MIAGARMVSLVVPGGSERMLAKARALQLDEVVIDLEDAVVPARKDEALALTLTALTAGFAAARVAVRVNQVGSPWIEKELAALSGAQVRPESVGVPKAEAGDAVREVAARVPVQALVETARGVRDADELAAVEGVHALIIGYADLALSVGRGAAGAANLDLWLATQDRVLTAARAAGVRAIDGPFLGIDDTSALRRTAVRAADLGFDGKWAIHPAQVEVIQAAFVPTGAAVAHARAVVQALAKAERAGAGAAQIDGAMIDEPVRLAALRVLARVGEQVAEVTE